MTSTVTTEVTFLNCLVFREDVDHCCFDCQCGIMFIDQRISGRHDVSAVCRGADVQVCCCVGFMCWQYKDAESVSTETHGFLSICSELKRFSEVVSEDISDLYNGKGELPLWMAKPTKQGLQWSKHMMMVSAQHPFLSPPWWVTCFQFWRSFQRITTSGTQHLETGSSYHCLDPWSCVAWWLPG